MIHFQIGDEVRVVRVPADEWGGASGVIVKTVERVSDDHADEFVQVRQRDPPVAAEKDRQVPADAIHKTDDRMLSVVGDGVCGVCHSDDASKAKILNMQSSILKLRLDIDTTSEVLERAERAGMEVDDFLGQLQERIRIATDITENPEAGRHILKIPA